MKYGEHKHNFFGNTTFNAGHMHEYSGFTSMDPTIPGHTHHIIGQTTFNNGHVHTYSLQTGPSISVNGGHTHYYKAETSVDNRHVHHIFGYTGVYNE